MAKAGVETVVGGVLACLAARRDAAADDGERRALDYLIRNPAALAGAIAATVGADGAPPVERYVISAELRRIIPNSEMTIWRWIRDPDIAFPGPVKLSNDGRNFWWLPAVLEWARARERRPDRAATGSNRRAGLDRGRNPSRNNRRAAVGRG